MDQTKVQKETERYSDDLLELQKMSESFKAFSRDIKIQHSIFALPFAFVAFAMADLPLPSVLDVVMLFVCMVCARSFAMGWNRYADRVIDSANPRTVGRMIPAGKLPSRHSLIITLSFAGVFCLSSFYFNTMTGLLSFPLLIVLGAYSYMKRVTRFCHFYLGLCLGLAPIAVSVALTGQVTLPLVMVAAAMTFWTAGFDILYALQDIDFDRSAGLKSLPSSLGVGRTVRFSRFCFFLTVLFMVMAGIFNGNNYAYFCGVVAVALLLSYEHFLIRPSLGSQGLKSNINRAFFNVNAYVSLTYCAFAYLDVLL